MNDIIYKIVDKCNATIIGKNSILESYCNNSEILSTLKALRKYNINFEEVKVDFDDLLSFIKNSYAGILNRSNPNIIPFFIKIANHLGQYSFKDYGKYIDCLSEKFQKRFHYNYILAVEYDLPFVCECGFYVEDLDSSCKILDWLSEKYGKDNVKKYLIANINRDDYRRLDKTDGDLTAGICYFIKLSGMNLE